MHDAHPSTTAPDLSVILPVYNGAGFISRSLALLTEHLERLGRSHEIIVVDDGSGDDTADVVGRDLPSVRCLRQERNQGKGAAVRRGMLAARGRYRFFVDADLPYDLSFIDTALRYLEVKEFDLVIGDRNVPGARFDVRFPLLRRLASRVYTLVIGRIVVTGVTDTQCGFKGFRKKAAEDLFSVSRIDRFAFDVEIVYVALKRNYDLKRLPVILEGEYDDSTVRLVRDSLVTFFDVLRIKANQVRGRYAPGRSSSGRVAG